MRVHASGTGNKRCNGASDLVSLSKKRRQRSVGQEVLGNENSSLVAEMRLPRPLPSSSEQGSVQGSNERRA